MLSAASHLWPIQVESLGCAQSDSFAVTQKRHCTRYLPHEIVEGSADKSYGIHVARLAGIPRSVIERAKTILAELESQHLDAEGQSRLTRADRRRRSSFIQHGLFWGAHDHIIDAVSRLELDSISPEEALAKLREIQNELNG